MKKEKSIHSIKYKVLLFLLCCVFINCNSEAKSESNNFYTGAFPYPERTIKVGFWFGTSNNELFHPEFVDWVGQRASIVLIRGAIEGKHEFFNYSNIVTRFKSSYPDLPFIIYQCLRYTKDENKINSYSWQYFKDKQEEYGIRFKDGTLLHMNTNSPSYFPNHAIPAVQDLFVQSTVDALKKYNADGVAFDASRLIVYDPVYQEWMRGSDSGDPDYWREINKNYSIGFTNAFRKIKAAIGPRKILIYNGLWNTRMNELDDQEKILPYVDMAHIEFFGREKETPHGKEHEYAPFKQFVLDYFTVMNRHPEKYYWIAGRTQLDSYLDYMEDYLIQRYVTASYLLGMTDKSFYKFHSSYQTVYVSPGRSYGMAYYTDYDIDLGQPVDTLVTTENTTSNAYWYRNFEKGTVYVAPMHEGDKIIKVNQLMYTPEGEEVKDTYPLQQGMGIMLLNYKPEPAPDQYVLYDFEKDHLGYWKGIVNEKKAEIIQEDDNKFCRLTLSKDDIFPYHQSFLQQIRTITPYVNFSMKIRTKDPKSAILLRVEVDDASPAPPLEKIRMKNGRANRKGETRDPYIAVIILPKESKLNFPKEGKDIAYGNLRPICNSPYIVVKDVNYSADNQWCEISLNLTDILKQQSPNFTPWRIPSMRILGDADIDDIVIKR